MVTYGIRNGPIFMSGCLFCVCVCASDEIENSREKIVIFIESILMDNVEYKIDLHFVEFHLHHVCWMCVCIGAVTHVVHPVVHHCIKEE